LALLEARALCAGYGAARVLFDADFALEAGEAVVLFGPNGAGKTTMLKTLMGLLRPDSGEVRFSGRRIEALPPFRIARLGLGYVPEDRRIFPGLTVRENLQVGSARDMELALKYFPDLLALRDRRGGTLSGGEQQMLAIARTLAGGPKALLLDEPTEGLAPRIVEAIGALILELKRRGATVLMAEQNRRFAARVADRALAIERGRIAPG